MGAVPVQVPLLTTLNATARLVKYQSTETGGLGASGRRVQKPAEGVKRADHGHALIQPPKMEDVRVQGPLLSPRLVTHYLAKYQLMENGESGANGPLVRKPVEAVTCQGAAHVATQPHRMGVVPVKDPALKQLLVMIGNVQKRVATRTVWAVLLEVRWLPIGTGRGKLGSRLLPMTLFFVADRFLIGSGY